MTQLLKLIKLMNSEVDPWQLALAVAFGFVFGISPLVSVQAMLVLVLLCFLRVNISMFILIALASTLLGVIISPVINQVGESVLLGVGTVEFWTAIYQYDAMRLVRFNHTTVMGSFLLSVLAFIPVYLLSLAAIKNYRSRLLTWVNQLHVVQLLKASEVFQLYQKVGE